MSEHHNDHNEHHSGHMGDGFLMGVIVGAAGMFLLGTKSGQNILKVLSEQGLDGIQNIIEEYNLGAEEEELEEQSPEVVEKVVEKEAEAKNHVEEKVEEVAPKKRFFKRLRR